MNAQHTPGPWVATNHRQINGEYTVTHGGFTIASCPEGDQASGIAFPAAANAALISKAPELVAGLRNIVRMLDGSQPKDPVGALMAARYLVHLATGGKA